MFGQPVQPSSSAPSRSYAQAARRTHVYHSLISESNRNDIQDQMTDDSKRFVTADELQQKSRPLELQFQQVQEQMQMFNQLQQSVKMMEQRINSLETTNDSLGKRINCLETTNGALLLLSPLVRIIWEHMQDYISVTLRRKVPEDLLNIVKDHAVKFPSLHVSDMRECLTYQKENKPAVVAQSLRKTIYDCLSENLHGASSFNGPAIEVCLQSLPAALTAAKSLFANTKSGTFEFVSVVCHWYKDQLNLPKRPV
jgi:hypothetical protein